jgi:hypothetical protein
MKTIIEILGLTDVTDDRVELLDFIDGEFVWCRNAGDLLGAGEWLIRKLAYVDEHQVEAIFSQVVALWSSPLELKASPVSVADLIAVVDEFAPEELTAALVATSLRVQQSPHTIPPAVNDLAFRLTQPISSIFGVVARRSADILKSAVSKLEAMGAELLAAVDSFTSTDCITAKAASVEVVKKSHQLKRLTFAAERPLLSELDFLLGATFRKFCESYEQNDTNSLLKRAPDLSRLGRVCKPRCYNHKRVAAINHMAR